MNSKWEIKHGKLVVEEKIFPDPIEYIRNSVEQHCEIEVLLFIVCVCSCQSLPEDIRLLRDDLIQYYFESGYSYNDILGFLCIVHGIQLSLPHLKRLLRQFGLRRNEQERPPLEILNKIIVLQSQGFEGFGYRTIWKMLNTYFRTRCTQRTVRLLLKAFTPNAVESRLFHRLQRRSYFNKGPNFLIHIDGYDKLKPFGIAIHGAIDGYSRKILWLKASETNKNPRIIARYYIDYILEQDGTPRVVRSDAGTENTLTREIQTFLREHNNDSMRGKKSFQVGKSTSNQRIEMFWSFLKKGFTQRWRNFFTDLRDSGRFIDSNELHINCIRFCFLPLIQRQLDMFRCTWNIHRIRRQRDKELPCGIPNVLFYQPQRNGDRDYKFDIPCSRNALRILREQCTDAPKDRGCSEEFWARLEDMSDLPRHELENFLPMQEDVALNLFEVLLPHLD